MDLNEPRITGNIKEIKTGKRIENLNMNKIMPDFFKTETENLKMINDSKNVLKKLSKLLQIIVLTNLPHKDKNKRVKALLKNDMNFPVITNSGLKGEAVKKILEKTKIKVKSFFIDDMPLNIDSVSKESPNTLCIHFIQDKRIKKLMPTPKSATISLHNWLDIEKFILENLNDDGEKET